MKKPNALSSLSEYADFIPGGFVAYDADDGRILFANEGMRELLGCTTQEELETLSLKWQNEVKAIYDKVEEMYSKYQTEMLLLSEDQKHAREQAIIAKEQEAKTLQMQYFGSEGQLYQKRTELIQPIQEKIYTAMQEIAQAKNYAFVLDLASGTSVLYASDKNDISDDVLDQLGNVMQTVRREDRKKANATSNSGSTGGKTSGNSGNAKPKK